MLAALALAALLDETKAPPTEPASRRARVVRYLAGGATGLAAHEGGHLACELLLGNRPDLHGVHFGPFPFFAIGPGRPTTPPERAVITSAGFWSQHASSEWMLSRHRGLRRESSPLRKGYLTFNVLTSVGYAGAAFFKAGPLERDTRGIAESSGVAEPVVGLMVLAPAALDAYRYFHPGSRWAPWASRATKLAFFVLAAKAPR
jgi:hypothetical protein